MKPATPFCHGAVVCLLLSAMMAVGTAAEDYPERLKAAEEARDEKQVQAVLDGWKQARPDDPEYYIAAANRAYHRSDGVSISTKPAQAGDFVLADPKTGKAVGSIARGGPSPKDDEEAIALLVQGLAKAPQRMDLYLGLATLYQESGDPKGVIEDLTEMVSYANTHPGKLQDKDGVPYPAPEDEHLSLAISGFADRYFQCSTAEGDQAFYQLARLDAEAFPNREYGHNLLGIYYTVVQKDPKLALASFERALKIVPDDSLVWINVGLLHARNGEKPEAAAAFQKVVDLHNDAGCAQQAQAELAKLK